MQLEQYLSDPQGMNSYSYVKNNPLKLVDPTGEYWLFAETRASWDIENNRENITSAAAMYPDVSADILAAAIYEERLGSGNVNPADLLDSPTAFMGVDSSIGLGQIRVSTAQGVADAGYFSIHDLYDDNFIGGNKLPDRIKLIQLLHNNKTNTIIGAAFMQKNIDEWKGVVPDVKNNAELQGSLYNYSGGKPTKDGYSNDFGRRVFNSVSRAERLLKFKGKKD